MLAAAAAVRVLTVSGVIDLRFLEFSLRFYTMNAFARSYLQSQGKNLSAAADAARAGAFVVKRETFSCLLQERDFYGNLYTSPPPPPRGPSL